MTDISLSGRVAVVTGGGRGMGREMALAFARAGAAGITITAAPASDESRYEIEQEIQGVVAEIERAGAPALGLVADVTSEDDCARVCRETTGRFSALHILVNNAGKSPRYAGPKRGIPFWEVVPAGWREIMDTNVNGPFLMARAAVPFMLAVGWGRIVNISKNADSMHQPFTTAYGPSKAALEAMTVSWAEELADTRVTVNVLQPGGAVDTKFGRGAVLGRGMSADVMVPMALWLASDRSDGVTGCRYSADRWDDAREADAAAEACREGPLFPVVTRRETKLTLAWTGPRG